MATRVTSVRVQLFADDRQRPRRPGVHRAPRPLPLRGLLALATLAGLPGRAGGHRHR